MRGLTVQTRTLREYWGEIARPHECPGTIGAQSSVGSALEVEQASFLKIVVLGAKARSTSSSKHRGAPAGRSASQ